MPTMANSNAAVCLSTERVSAPCDVCGNRAKPCHLVEEIGRIGLFCAEHCPAQHPTKATRKPKDAPDAAGRMSGIPPPLENRS